MPELRVIYVPGFRKVNPALVVKFLIAVEPLREMVTASPVCSARAGLMAATTAAMAAAVAAYR